MSAKVVAACWRTRASARSDGVLVREQVRQPFGKDAVITEKGGMHTFTWKLLMTLLYSTGEVNSDQIMNHTGRQTSVVQELRRMRGRKSD